MFNGNSSRVSCGDLVDFYLERLSTDGQWTRCEDTPSVNIGGAHCFNTLREEKHIKFRLIYTSLPKTSFAWKLQALPSSILAVNRLDRILHKDMKVQLELK